MQKISLFNPELSPSSSQHSSTRHSATSGSRSNGAKVTPIAENQPEKVLKNQQEIDSEFKGGQNADSKLVAVNNINQNTAEDDTTTKSSSKCHNEPGSA